MITPFVLPDAGTYYDLILTTSPSFVTDIETRIRTPYTRISYDNFDETNIANFASIDNGNGTRSVYCVYSGYEYVYSGTFMWGTMSREHTWAHSWMPTFPSQSNDQYSDQHHLFPTHQNNANGRRSNHPFGIVVNVTYQFLEGKVGTNSLGQIVYEPRDAHKGDVARSLLYMTVRYDGIGGNSWNFNTLNGTTLPGLSESPQDLNVLLNWHRQDPPDKWEVDRNNYIQSVQQNRNPFVDHPEYMSFIDFNNLSKLNPVYAAEPTNYVTSFSSSAAGSSINLSWNDAAGAQLPSGYLIIAYNKNNYFLPIDGSEYTSDTTLSDGAAIVNVPYAAANNYSFSNLPLSNTYYFSIFSYNGSGAQINYKINGTFPASNTFLTGTLAAEPSNHATGFALNNITENSMQLSWTDALPGSQAPSGYLLMANNHNSFITPSDGTVYDTDTILSDGNALINIPYAAADNYTFSGLFSNTNYYFRLYSYNGTGSLINYKTSPVVPNTAGVTSGSTTIAGSVLLDNFNRTSSSSLGNTMLPQMLTWQETETAGPGSTVISGNRVKMGGITAGRDLAYVDIGSISSYPDVYGNSTGQLVWAFNFRQTRLDPSGFDNANYGMAFILGKTTTDIATGNGYAVVIGNSGSTDPVRLAKFTNGVNGNSRFTNIIANGDYSNQYLSIKVVFTPSGNSWSLYVDSSSAGFPQEDPRNTATQTGTASDSTYTTVSLPYLGAMWNHNTAAADSMIFDDIYIPSGSTTMNITAVTEGYYNTGTGKMNMKDTMTVYLRNSVVPYQIVDSAKGIIDSVTFTGTFNFINVSSGNYYLHLKGRNSLETWSKLPQTVTAGSTGSYDFTDSQTKAFGDNLVLKGTEYCIYSGDINKDGAVNLTDILAIQNASGMFTMGYVVTDLTGNNSVDLADIAIAFNNASKFTARKIP